MACTEWCPQQAVIHSNRKEGITYHHPDVKLSDMLVKASPNPSKGGEPKKIKDV
jgi:formate hydrogenlyase subunit 6/NADH:ubiquinone oxidoreductase subunit I